MYKIHDLLDDGMSLILWPMQSFDADNLAANFSRELADYIIYIIDVSGGDKIPRKGGPGITQADLLVILHLSVSLLSCNSVEEFTYQN